MSVDNYEFHEARPPQKPRVYKEGWSWVAERVDPYITTRIRFNEWKEAFAYATQPLKGRTQ